MLVHVEWTRDGEMARESCTCQLVLGHMPMATLQRSSAWWAEETGITLIKVPPTLEQSLAQHIVLYDPWCKSRQSREVVISAFGSA